MILFTGSGKIASAYLSKFPGKYVSARNLDDQELSKELFEATVVIHNAAIINSGSVLDFFEGNCILTKRILDLLSVVNPRARFINLSSMSFLETENKYLPVEEMSNYAFSKYTSEVFCIRYPYSDLVNVRFSTIFYGDFDKDGISRLIYSFVQGNVTIFNNGEAYRDILPLEILICYLHKITFAKSLPRVMNVAAGKSYSFKNILDFLILNSSNVQIENKIQKLPEVLSSFSKKHIDIVGEISFDLRDYVIEYYKLLNSEK
jgi:hypothetical protein